MLQWPDLLEDSFSFVAAYQMFSDIGWFAEAHPGLDAKVAAWKGSAKDVPAELQPVAELYYFIKKNGRMALNIETQLTEIASAKSEA